MDLKDIEPTLNTLQQLAFDACVNDPKSVFCTGCGGTGKSRVLESVVEYLKAQSSDKSGVVAVTASTGIAAFLINGITLHKFAGVGIEENDISIMIAKASRGRSKAYWRNVHTLVIDEVSMVSPVFFENLSTLAKAMKKVEEPFGGIRLLMFGDFLQLPPVSKTGGISTRIFHTKAWHELNPKVIELLDIVRQTDPKFKQVLLELRRGVCSESSENYIKSLERNIPHENGIVPIKLYAKRNSMEAYNKNMLHTIDEPLIVYESIDTGDVSLLSQCPCQKTLELKLGCQVILTRNITRSAVNGSIGKVVGFEVTKSSLGRRPIVEFRHRDGSMETMSITRIVWNVTSPDGATIASRFQIPLSLAWAITIHKSQGQTIYPLCVDASEIFETGQAYVGIGRCPSPSQLQVLNFDKKCIMASAPCIQFYDSIESTNYCSDSSVHETTSATCVARETLPKWDKNIAPPETPLERTSIDTQIMLGNLHLKDTSTDSVLDFDLL